MVLRLCGWRVLASAAVCLTVADSPRLLAAEMMGPFLPDRTLLADTIDTAVDRSLITGGVTPRLVWGGPVPGAPKPGEMPVYVPSPSAVPSRPQPQPQFMLPPEEALPDLPPAAEQPYPGEPPTEASAPLLAPGEGEEQTFRDGEQSPEEPADAASGPRESLAGESDPDFAPEPLYAPEDDVTPASSRTKRSGAGADASGANGSGGLLAPATQAPEAALPPSAPEVREAALPPLGAPREIEDQQRYGSLPPQGEADPFQDMSAPAPEPRAAPRKALPSYASLQDAAPIRGRPPAGSILEGRGLEGRGALEDETPTGYQPMPQQEAMCRTALAKLGVGFTDATSIRRSASCGIDYPVKVVDIAPGIAIRPAATLNCMAALRVAQWVRDEVKPAARWKMFKRPTVLINASSYRCSRIAGSRSISEHASGNALDVHGFKFSDGSFMEIEKKGFFSFREKSFQTAVRESACRYFGTVLGPGYNEDHADHLHLDAKQRRSGVCK